MNNWISFYFFAISAYTTFVTANAHNSSVEGGYFYYPNDSGKLQRIDSQEPADYELIEKLLTTDAITFNLFTRRNPSVSQQLFLGDSVTLLKSHYNKHKNTVFTSHSWLGDKDSPVNIALTPALLDDDDVNIIVLDWSKLANTGYPTAVCAVPKVGKVLGEFIKWLNEFNIDYDTIHLIGYGLGGHVVGCAGRETNSNVARITALDPAGPFFRYNPYRITRNDSRYVEIIHTNTKDYGFGYHDRSGHADFYPNGGLTQPGCPSEILETFACSHTRSWELFKSSILYKNKFLANRCQSVHEAESGLCKGDVSPMGNTDLKKHIWGIFGLKTTGKYPYF